MRISLPFGLRLSPEEGYLDHQEKGDPIIDDPLVPCKIRL
jgi:hypothetical protein